MKDIASANFPHLTFLDVSANNIGDLGAEIIGSSNCPQLIKLELTFCEIGTKGAMDIGSANFPLLKIIFFHGNNIDDTLAKVLTEDGRFNLSSTFNNINILEYP